MGGTMTQYSPRAIADADLYYTITQDLFGPTMMKAPFGSKMSGWGVPVAGHAVSGLAAWLPLPVQPISGVIRYDRLPNYITESQFFGVGREPRRPRTLLALSGKINLRLGLRGK